MKNCPECGYQEESYWWICPRCGYKLVSRVIIPFLKKLCENPDLIRALDNIEFQPNDRLRILLELDILPDGSIRQHGFEFRFRRPSEGLKP